MGSAENRAAVVGAYKAFAEGDVASVIALNAPDAVWVNHSSPSSALQGEHKGIDAIGEFFAQIGASIDMTQFDMEPIAAEGHVVVATGHQRYTVKATGKTVAGPVVHVFHFGADGKVTRFEEYEVEVGDAWDA